MIRINYQTFGTKGFALRMRFYQNGVIKYIVVTKLLKGNILKRHWNAKKQMFVPSAPYSDENNDTLMKLRKKYEDKAIEWTGSLESFLLYVKNGQSTPTPNSHKFNDIIEYIVSELKKETREDGTVKGTFEAYLKLARRIEDFCIFSGIEYSNLCIEDFNAKMVNRLFDWIRFKKNGKGMVYISTTLHAVLVRCEKIGFYDMKLVSMCKWAKNKKQSAHKYYTLNDEQCKKFIELDISKLPKNPYNELYHDFCVFILFTCQSACDAIALQYKDIEMIGGVEHFVFKRRKIAEKQAVSCTVPINSIMKEIMNRWKPFSQDGYIFPIRNKERMRKQKVNNGDIKHFISRLNIWLKKVGVLINCSFPLHSYTFRHTGITHYISSGITPIYIANLAGTSVDNCEKIYYNNQGDQKSRNQVLNAIKF